MKVTIPSKYVKPDINIKEGDVVSLLNEGEIKVMNTVEGPKEVYQFRMKMTNEETKDYTMNATTMKNLISEWGDESRKWVGKELKAWIVSQFAFGKTIRVLILTPKDWAKIDEKAASTIVEDTEEEYEDVPEELE